MEFLISDDVWNYGRTPFIWSSFIEMKFYEECDLLGEWEISDRDNFY